MTPSRSRGASSSIRSSISRASPLGALLEGAHGRGEAEIALGATARRPVLELTWWSAASTRACILRAPRARGRRERRLGWGARLRGRGDAACGHRRSDPVDGRDGRRAAAPSARRLRAGIRGGEHRHARRLLELTSALVTRRRARERAPRGRRRALRGRGELHGPPRARLRSNGDPHRRRGQRAKTRAMRRAPGPGRARALPEGSSMPWTRTPMTIAPSDRPRRPRPAPDGRARRSCRASSPRPSREARRLRLVRPADPRARPRDPGARLRARHPRGLRDVSADEPPRDARGHPSRGAEAARADEARWSTCRLRAEARTFRASLHLRRLRPLRSRRGRRARTATPSDASTAVRASRSLDRDHAGVLQGVRGSAAKRGLEAARTPPRSSRSPSARVTERVPLREGRRRAGRRQRRSRLDGAPACARVAAPQARAPRRRPRRRSRPAPRGGERARPRRGARPRPRRPFRPHGGPCASSGAETSRRGPAPPGTLRCARRRGGRRRHGHRHRAPRRRSRGDGPPPPPPGRRSPRGLAVLPPRAGDLVRPLIRARRADIEAHLATGTRSASPRTRPTPIRASCASGYGASCSRCSRVCRRASSPTSARSPTSSLAHAIRPDEGRARLGKVAAHMRTLRARIALADLARTNSRKARVRLPTALWPATIVTSFHRDPQRISPGEEERRRVVAPAIAASARGLRLLLRADLGWKKPKIRW